MIKTSASRKKKPPFWRLLHIKSKSLAIVAGLMHLFYHHRLDVVPDGGDIAIVMPSNPIANQQAETTPRPC